MPQDPGGGGEPGGGGVGGGGGVIEEQDPALKEKSSMAMSPV